ncbi:MAG TPA: DUF3828 domain-containing protein [Thermoanaerobaculia bacterium]|jgi:hypothetical protein
MTFRTIAAAMAVVIAAACSNEPAQPSPAPAAPAATNTVAVPREPLPHDAEALVAELYREHDAQRGPFFQTESKERLDKYFEPSFAELIWRDAVESKGEVGALDFDPLYDGQDVEPKNLAVGPARLEGGSALVPVSYENYGKKRQLTCVLARAGESWKISDIRYEDGRALRDVYQPAT